MLHGATIVNLDVTMTVRNSQYSNEIELCPGWSILRQDIFARQLMVWVTNATASG